MPAPVSNSGDSSIINSLRRIPTSGAYQTEHQISLVDQERPVEESHDAEQDHSETSTILPSTPTHFPPLVKKLTTNSQHLQQSLKRELTRRKYAKYDRGRYDLDYDSTPPQGDISERSTTTGENSTAAQKSYLGRGTAKAKTLLGRKKKSRARKDEEDTVLDVLYENQRGMFLFGIPKYSSSSLLPTDPKPWQNAQFRTSPVDIRNAQVPDPSWDWAWKNWYVDMSRDVDEEGWEYSLMFKGGTNWHGNHPWIHSFVRRRRWLRMRRRRGTLHHHTTEKGHELTAEYFTIHPKTLRPVSEDLTRVPSTELLRFHADLEDETDMEKVEIPDIGSLVLFLRKAAVDREKLVAVRKFLAEGGEDIYYLSPRMPEIMSLFIYQSSRRQLLTELLHHFNSAKERRESLTEHRHVDEESQREHDKAARQADNLMNAVEAADAQVKKLEYWSDIKGMSQEGQILQRDSSTGGGNKWDTQRWSGLTSPSAEAEHPQKPFASKQDASEGAPELHKHPENDDNTNNDAASKKSSTFFDAKQSSKDSSDGGGGGSDHFSIAPESASEISRGSSGGGRKGKGKATVSSALDGIDDDDEEDESIEQEEGQDALGDVAKEEQQQEQQEPALPDLVARARERSVQVVEPVPES